MVWELYLQDSNEWYSKKHITAIQMSPLISIIYLDNR